MRVLEIKKDEFLQELENALDFLVYNPEYECVVKVDNKTTEYAYIEYFDHFADSLRNTYEILIGQTEIDRANNEYVDFLKLTREGIERMIVLLENIGDSTIKLAYSDFAHTVAMVNIDILYL